MANSYDNWQSRYSEDAVNQRKQSDWENAMSALSAAAAAKASPDTMVGLAIGKMLSKLLFPEDQLQAKTDGTKTEDGSKDSGRTTTVISTPTSEMKPTSEYALLGSLGQGAVNQQAQDNPILQYGTPGGSLYDMALQNEGLKNADGTYNMVAKPKYDFSVTEIMSGR